MRLLIIDNHDSFVYNIMGLIGEIRSRGEFPDLECDIRLNDEIEVEEAGRYDAIILSPGPGLPSEAGRMPEILRTYAGSIPMLGVCLGFQAIAEHFGARLLHLATPRHGHLTHLCSIVPDDRLVGSLAGSRPTVGRYHSWVVDTASLPSCLVPTSFDEEGNLMSLSHRTLPIFGTQFHPESIISDCGQAIMRNFLNATRR